MKSVTITRQTAASTRPGNYRVDLTITSANDITAYLFVKQRILLPDGTPDDFFTTIASPTQIEDIPQLVPGTDSSFFRDNKVSLVSSDTTTLNEVVEDILLDIQYTLAQATDLETLTPSEIITVTPTGVTVN